MLILTFVQRKRNAHGLIVACHAELQFVGFEEVGFCYLFVPFMMATAGVVHSDVLAHHESALTYNFNPNSKSFKYAGVIVAQNISVLLVGIMHALHFVGRDE